MFHLLITVLCYAMLTQFTSLLIFVDESIFKKGSAENHTIGSVVKPESDVNKLTKIVVN